MYHCAIDKELFAAKIAEAQKFAADRGDQWIVIDVAAIGDEDQIFALKAIGFLLHPTRPDRLRAHPDQSVLDHLKTHKIKYERERFEDATVMEIRLRVEAVNRWYVHDWNTLDNKIRSSIVEGVSVSCSALWARWVRPSFIFADLRVRVLRMHPVVVGPLLRALPVQPVQLGARRRGDVRRGRLLRPVLLSVVEQCRSREFLRRVIEASEKNLPWLALSCGEYRLGTGTDIDARDRLVVDRAEAHG